MGEGPARLSALSVLVFGGPKALGELAAAEQVKPPTMRPGWLPGLARSRLMTISADPHDARRMQVIHATAKGIRLPLPEGTPNARAAYPAAHLDRLALEELAKLGQAVPKP